MSKKKATESVNFAEQTTEEKLKALQTTIANIEKTFGKGSVIKLGENSNKDIEVIPTGSLSLDVALGVGGIPRGRIIEIFGAESSGKTTLALHIAASVQKSGGIVSFIDAEHALDPSYAAKLGLNINELYISQPDNGEQALEIAEQMIRSGAIELVIIDSVAALTPKAEIDGEMTEASVGMQARLMSKGLRKITAFVNKTGCTVIFINQLREKIGAYGNPETTTGGRALKFYASIRIEIRKGGVADQIKQGDSIIGNKATAKVVKNKVAPPFKVAVFDIMYGEGINSVGDILDLAEDLNIVSRGGSWYSYKEAKIGQGRDKAKEYLKSNPHICREIENTVRTHYKMEVLPVIEAPETTTDPTEVVENEDN